MSHCFWVARQEFFCHVCSSTTCNCLLSLLKSNTSSPFFPLSKMPYIANAAYYFGIFMHMWILHAHILKFWFSPINLSVFIWFLAQLEELRRWKEKHSFFFLSLHTVQLSPWDLPSPHPGGSLPQLCWIHWFLDSTSSLFLIHSTVLVEHILQ